MKRVKRPELRLHGQKVRLKKKPVILAVSVLVLIVLLVSVSVHAASKKHTQKVSAGVAEETAAAVEETTVAEEKLSEEETTTAEEETTLPEVQTTTAAAPQTDGEGEYPGCKKVYLTFDDGPSPNTTRILDILDQYGVKATFFTICSPGEENEESLKRIVSSGNTLAIHSVSHEYSQVYASIDSFKEDVLDMQQWLYEQINFLNEQGFVYFDWNVSSGDASAKCVDKDTIVQNVLSEIGSREEYVVLMHDAGAKTTTVEALPEIIEYLQANDYMILPITANTKPVQHRHS